MRAHAVLERRIVAARERAFVGRTAELALFERTLTGAPDAPPVLWFHGPGGIGKSALLDRFAHRARAEGRLVVAVDGGNVEPTAEAFAAAARPVLREEGGLLLVDAFERFAGLENWLMEEFLPRIPLGTAVIVAGRNAPNPRWTADPGWADVLRSVALREFGPVESARYLQLRGLPRSAQRALLPVVGGNPLALSLAAEALGTAARGTSAAQPAVSPPEWRPGQDVLGSLLPHLLGRLPDPDHRRALEVCAHLRVTTETLLRDVLGERAPELFDWLRAQPFVEGADDGLYPHDAVCGALRADLRWRDPEGARELHERLHRLLLARVRSVTDAEVPRAVHDLMFLHARADRRCGYRTAGGVREAPYAPGDRAQVLALARQAEGEDSAALVAHWLDRQPEAFRVYRAAGGDEDGIVAFLAVPHLPVGTPDAADPHTGRDVVVAAALEHARGTAPSLPGDLIAVVRFLVAAPGDWAGDSWRAMWWRLCGELVRTERLTWVFTAARDGKHGWCPAERYLPAVDHQPVTAGPAATLRGLDLRIHGPVSFLEASLRATLSGEPRPAVATRHEPATAPPTLPRADFDLAVRDALRALRSPDLLAVNPLSRCRIAAGADTDLAAVLDRAIAALPGERGGTKRHRALVTTYVKGAPTQQAAAHRLGLPFSTYRRHLTGAVQQVCDLLWQWELNGVPPEAGPGSEPRPGSGARHAASHGTRP
ncbi:ATP-binding protein [Streptomyces sp. NRRL S-474]|uniref:ATP-binding protein n=1 Tax=Streptomyces sp. NRRL S-474 TaxID=1463909 RepID=UPI00068D89C0|nr:ATP-binding protein [Streptomyces sp. NRRL S-474]